MIPSTSEHVRPMAAPVMGLVPTSPLMEVLNTSVTPDFDSTVKLLADARFIGVSGAAATALVVPAASMEMIAIGIMERVLSLKVLLMVFSKSEACSSLRPVGTRREKPRRFAWPDCLGGAGVPYMT